MKDERQEDETAGGAAMRTVEKVRDAMGLVRDLTGTASSALEQADMPHTDTMRWVRDLTGTASSALEQADMPHTIKISFMLVKVDNDECLALAYMAMYGAAFVLMEGANRLEDYYTANRAGTTLRETADAYLLRNTHPDPHHGVDEISGAMISAMCAINHAGYDDLTKLRPSKDQRSLFPPIHHLSHRERRKMAASDNDECLALAYAAMYGAAFVLMEEANRLEGYYRGGHAGTTIRGRGRDLLALYGLPSGKRAGRIKDAMWHAIEEIEQLGHDDLTKLKPSRP